MLQPDISEVRLSLLSERLNGDTKPQKRENLGPQKVKSGQKKPGQAQMVGQKQNVSG